MYAEEDQLDFGEEDVVDAAPAAEEEAPVHLSSSRPSSKTGETTSSSQPRLVDSDPNSSSAVDVGSGPSSTAKPSTAAESKGEDERFKEAVDAPVGSLLSRMSDRPVADEQLAKRIDEAQPPLGSTTAWERSAEVGKRQVKASPGRREDVSFAKQSDAQGADSPSRPIASKKSLPEGWEAVASRTGGDTYFFNSITGESQWDVPQAPATNSALRAEKEVTQDTVDLSEADRRLHADSSKRVTASVAPSPEDRPRRDARDAPQILSIKGSASRSRQLSPNSLQQQQRKRGLEQLDKRAHDSASEAGLSIRGASSASTTQRSVEVPSELPFNKRRREQGPDDDDHAVKSRTNERSSQPTTERLSNPSDRAAPALSSPASRPSQRGRNDGPVEQKSTIASAWGRARAERDQRAASTNNVHARGSSNERRAEASSFGSRSSVRAHEDRDARADHKERTADSRTPAQERTDHADRNERRTTSRDEDSSQGRREDHTRSPPRGRLAGTTSSREQPDAADRRQRKPRPSSRDRSDAAANGREHSDARDFKRYATESESGHNAPSHDTERGGSRGKEHFDGRSVQELPDRNTHGRYTAGEGPSSGARPMRAWGQPQADANGRRRAADQILRRPDESPVVSAHTRSDAHSEQSRAVDTPQSNARWPVRGGPTSREEMARPSRLEEASRPSVNARREDRSSPQRKLEGEGRTFAAPEPITRSDRGARAPRPTGANTLPSSNTRAWGAPASQSDAVVRNAGGSVDGSAEPPREEVSLRSYSPSTSRSTRWGLTRQVRTEADERSAGGKGINAAMSPARSRNAPDDTRREQPDERPRGSCEDDRRAEIGTERHLDVYAPRESDSDRGPAPPSRWPRRGDSYRPTVQRKEEEEGTPQSLRALDPSRSSSMRGRDDARQGGTREQRDAAVDGIGGATATQEERRRLELEEREAALRRREMELWERERRLYGAR